MNLMQFVLLSAWARPTRAAMLHLRVAIITQIDNLEMPLQRACSCTEQKRNILDLYVELRDRKTGAKTYPKVFKKVYSIDGLVYRREGRDGRNFFCKKGIIATLANTLGGVLMGAS